MEDWKVWVKRYFGHLYINTDEGFTRIIGEEDDLIDFIEQELDRAREEWTDELKQAFHEVFYKSGELWFNYIFEDGDTEAEQEAKDVVEDYWDEIISKLTTK